MLSFNVKICIDVSVFNNLISNELSILTIMAVKPEIQFKSSFQLIVVCMTVCVELKSVSWPQVIGQYSQHTK